MQASNYTKLSTEAVLFYAVIFVASFALTHFVAPLAFILLGSAFIFMAPFMVIERASMPFKVLRHDAVSIALGMLLVFVGGSCWLAATLV